MAAVAGNNMALSILINGTYTVIAGLQARSFKIDETNVDVTTVDSTSRWQEMLPGAGVRKLEIDASGIWQRDAGTKTVVNTMLAGSLITARIAWPNGGVQFDASFLVDNFSWDTPYDNAGKFSLKLSSSGAVTLTFS